MTSDIGTIDERNHGNESHPRPPPHHSIAWDPSNPSALLIVSNVGKHDDDDDDNNNDHSTTANRTAHQSDTTDHIQFGTWYSDVGNVNGTVTPYELTSLLRLISDYERRLQQQQQHGTTPRTENHIENDADVDPPAPQSYREQSQRYRTTVSDLLSELEANHDESDEDEDKAEQELLHQINSILYLSEIYLLPPSNIDPEQENEDNHYYCCYYSDGTVRNWFDCPGVATADTVRFLRQFVLSPPPPPSNGRRPNTKDNNVEEEEDVMMMENDNDDEELSPNRNFLDFPNEEAYWDELLLNCKCGYLHVAWYLLQTHPWYVAAKQGLQQYMDDDTSGSSSDNAIDRASLQAMVNDWHQIGGVLLTAPIPGGRSTSFVAENDWDDPLLSDDDIELTYVDGLNVSRADDQFWDIPSSSSTIDRTTNGDRPMVYIPDVAMHKHQSWSDYVKHVREHNRLSQRLTNIDTILVLLSGDYNSTKRHNHDTVAGRNAASSLFSSWPEQLCCELLYRTPNLRPRSIASRTSVLVHAYHRQAMTPNHRSGSAHDEAPPPEANSSSLSAYESSIIAIMQGNAGRTIVELYDLGGGSGAAVPTALLALVFDLFAEAKIIPQASMEKRFTFLIDASSSIVASLRSSHPDIGVQLAIRLLLPQMTKVTSSFVRGEFVGAISNILEHYKPTTDHYARTALSLCIPLLSKTEQSFNNKERQWQRVLLDGCISVFIQLYRKYEREGINNHTEEVMDLLLEGINLESGVLSQPWLGTCYHLLDALCYKAVLSLLQAIAGTSVGIESGADASQPFDPLYIFIAEPMSKVIDQYLSSTTASTASTIGAHTTFQFNSTQRLPSAALLLVNVAEMLTLALSGNSQKELAKQITAFLSKCNSSSSSISLQWWTLRVARCLIERCNDVVFDSNDVTILLQHLSEVKSWTELIASDDATNARFIGSLSEQSDMQLCFHGLLLQTICTQNAAKTKKICTDTSAQGTKDIVKNMLD